MPFLIENIQLSRFSESTNELACIELLYDRNTQTAFAPVRTAIGMRHVMVMEVSVTAPDTLNDKILLFTPRMYAPAGSSDIPNANTGFEHVIDGAPSVIMPATWNARPLQSRNENVTYFWNEFTNTLSVSWEFHVLSDLHEWPQQTVYPQRRLLSTDNDGTYMSDNTPTAFNSIDAELQAFLRIRNGVDLVTNATYADGGGNERSLLKVPFVPTWYGRGDGSLAYDWHTLQFQNTINGELIASKTFLNDPYDNSLYDNNFNEFGSELSPFQDNELSFIIETPAGTVDKAQVFVFREGTNGAIGYIYDVIEYREHGMLDAATTAITDAPFIGPATFNLPGTTGQITFTLNPDYLEYGKKYRVGVLLHDTAACNTFAVISHSLSATALPVCDIETESYLGNYCEEQAVWFGKFAKHERFSSRAVFDLNTFFTCMQDGGLNVTISDLKRISYSVLKTNQINATNADSATYASVLAYSANNGILELAFSSVESHSVTLDSNIIDALAVYRIAESWQANDPLSPFLGAFIPVKWVLEFDILVPDGTVCRVKYNAIQRLCVDVWEDETALPDVLINVFDGDAGINARKPVRTLCGIDKLVFEVIKQNDCAGLPALFQPNFYPVTPGTLNPITGVQESEADAPGDTSQLAQLMRLPIYDVTPFVGDVATFCLNTSDLSQDAEYYVDAVICKTGGIDCCPVLGEIPVLNYYALRAGNFAYVYIILSPLYNFITAAANSGVNVLANEVLSDATGPTNILTYTATTNVIYARLTMNDGTTSAIWNFNTEAQFTCIDGEHVVRHDTQFVITLPTGNQGWQINTMPTDIINCIDQGLI